ncbi:ribonuclease H-like domain-containing protein [Tanacetum coccineum]
MSPENKEHYQSEKEAIHLLLTGIRDEIYSTVDGCMIAHDMQIAIERLQQGESLNIQDVKTNLFWEFGKFTSHDRESMESYYRFYKMMNEMIRNNLTVATMQYQKEVNEIHGKEIAKPITPPSELAFEEDSDPEQAQRDKDMQKNLALNAKYFKKIYKPTTNNLRTSSNSRNKNLDTSPRYKNDNQTGQFGNQRTVTVAGARETVGSQVVQHTGTQCFNCKEFGHFAKECRKPKRVKDYSYHKEKMLLCKQAEKGVPLQGEQADWLADTDEEIDEQELEAHYSYMAKIQEVPTADSGTDTEPLEHNIRVFFHYYQTLAPTPPLFLFLTPLPATLRPPPADAHDITTSIPIAGHHLPCHISSPSSPSTRHHFHPPSPSTPPPAARHRCTIPPTPPSPPSPTIATINLRHHHHRCPQDKGVFGLQRPTKSDQNAKDEHVALANLITNLKLDVDENKKIQKQLKKANTSLAHELNESKSILVETSRTLRESNRLLAQKEIDIKEGLKLKAYEISVVEEKHDELVKHSLLTKSHYEGLVKEKTKVIRDLKLKEEKDIDKMISMEKQLKFLNEIVYKRNQSIQTIHMLAPKGPTLNGSPTFANPMYLKKAQSEKPCLYEIPYDQSDPANRLVPDREETLTLEKESRSKLNK